MESCKMELLGNLTAVDKNLKELKSYVCSLFSVYPLTDRENKQQNELSEKYKSCKKILEKIENELRKFDNRLDSVYEMRTKLLEEKQKKYKERSRLYTPSYHKTEQIKDRKQQDSTLRPSKRLSCTSLVGQISVNKNKGANYNLNKSSLFNRRQTMVASKVSLFSVEKKTVESSHFGNKSDKILPLSTSNNANNRILKLPRASLCNSALLKPRTNTTDNSNNNETCISKSSIFKVPAPLPSTIATSLAKPIHGNVDLCSSNSTNSNKPCCTPSRIPIASSIQNNNQIPTPNSINNNENNYTRKSVYLSNLLKSSTIVGPTPIKSTIKSCENPLPSITTPIFNKQPSTSANIVLKSNFGLPKNNDSDNSLENQKSHIKKRESLLPTPSGLVSTFKTPSLSITKPNLSVFTPKLSLKKPKSPVLESLEDNNMP